MFYSYHYCRNYEAASAFFLGWNKKKKLSRKRPLAEGGRGREGEGGAESPEDRSHRGREREIRWKQMIYKHNETLHKIANSTFLCKYLAGPKRIFRRFTIHISESFIMERCCFTRLRKI